MKRVPITIFRTHCSKLLEQVGKTKKAICITRRGKPVAEVIPDRTSWIGSMKNSMKIIGNIVSPASDENEWEVLRDPSRVADPRPQNRKS